VIYEIKPHDYFSNLVNKMTITPIATNANPRRVHNPITDTNSKVGALSPPALILRNHDANDIKIKPIMKVTIPDPNNIFFLFIISLIKNYYQSINIFGDNKIHTNSSHNLFLFFQLIKKHLIILLRIKNKRNTLKSTIFTKVIHTDYREVAKNIFTPTT